MKSVYREGDWFAVPLDEGGFAPGLVARSSRSGILFGYFFGPKRIEIPYLDQLEHLKASAAILVGKFGHLGLKTGTWTIIGRSPSWDRQAWPMPPQVRYEELTGRTFHVYYDDADASRRLREVQVAAGPREQGPRDALMGAGYVEGLLTRLLA